MTIENAIIETHLIHFQPTPLGTYFSGFRAALRDARKMTGRNQDTGVKESIDDLGSWLGSMGYLTLLDQIGNCFRRVDIEIANSNMSSIKKALKNFTSLNENEINAIYALRNSFAHDFSLQNIDKNSDGTIRNRGLNHHFKVVSDNVQQLVVLPNLSWDGLIANQTDQNKTVINLQKLGDTVEKMVEDLISLNKRKQIKIILDGGSEELMKRYWFGSGYLVQ